MLIMTCWREFLLSYMFDSNGWVQSSSRMAFSMHGSLDHSVQHICTNISYGLIYYCFRCHNSGFPFYGVWSYWPKRRYWRYCRWQRRYPGTTWKGKVQSSRLMLDSQWNILNDLCTFESSKLGWQGKVQSEAKDANNLTSLFSQRVRLCKTL